MSTSYAVSDSLTMLGRQFRRFRRYPSLSVVIVGMPLIFLLLFVYVFGGTLGAGLGGASGGRAEYLEYVTPGILMMTVAASVTGTAVSVSMDMTEGIIARFRTMAISRASVLIGHVLGSTIQTMVGMGVVLGAATLLGFRPNASPLEWLSLIGILLLITLALIWLAVALGLVSDSVETASNLPMPLVLLPFLGSGFVPTDSMPVGLRWFAEYQPFTSGIETIRGLLVGTPIGHNAVITIAWCAALIVGGYVWATRLYNRDPSS
jgi:ABC-2 type transport system permease protein